MSSHLDCSFRCLMLGIVVMATFNLHQLRITEQAYREFVRACADSVSSNLWICASCGVSSFDLERANTVRETSCTRTCNWRTVSRTEAVTRYLSVNPHIAQFAAPANGPNRVRVCPTCANPQRHHKAMHVPTVPSNIYNAAVSESNFAHL
jgi:hypothetical protein